MTDTNMLTLTTGAGEVIKVGVRINWMEYERGWGQRPDGATLHRSMKVAQDYVGAYWSRQPGGTAPDDYSAPGDPALIQITDAEFERLTNEESFWLEGRSDNRPTVEHALKEMLGFVEGQSDRGRVFAR